MKHSWTGGQYSVWRAAFAVAVGCALDRVLQGYALRLPAAALCFALAIGFRDRTAAWALAAAWWITFRHTLDGSSDGLWAVILLLVLHGTTHGAPYGAFDARGRPEPSGSWILPAWNLAARRLVAASVAVLWIARGHLEVPPYVAGALLAAALDPGWIPARLEASPTLVFYDGVCGLCHRFVRFLLAEDRTGDRFRYAPLQGETFAAAYPPDVRASYPDSIVVVGPAGDALLRSRAAILCLDRLGGLWRALAFAMRLVPAPIRDAVYDAVAAVRKKVFAKPEDICPIVPAYLARRFDP